MPLSATHDFIPIFFIFFISKFSLYMIFRFLQFSSAKQRIFLINHYEKAPKTLLIPNNNLNFAA